MRFSPYFKVMEMLDHLEIVYQLQMNNAIMGRSILTVGPNSSDEYVTKMITKLLKLDPVIKLGAADKGGVPTDTGFNRIQDFKDRTNELITYYNFIWDQIQTIVGMDSNAMPNKREREINAEIEVNNSESDAINAIELRYRREGLKMIKKVFKLDITVQMSDIIKPKQETEGDEDAGGENQRDRTNSGN